MAKEDRRATKFRGARFASKRDRKRACRENTGVTYFDRAPALVSFHRGQVLHARVYFEDDPGTYKIRPVVFLQKVDRQVAEVLPAYSSMRRATRPRAVPIEIGRRGCYLSLDSIHVDRLDLVTSTRQTLDLLQLHHDGLEDREF